MHTLPPPIPQYLRAAEGWMELGNLVEARNEIKSIENAFQKHPDVLEVSWLIEASDKAWQEAERVARQLVEDAPERASGWLHLSYSVRRNKPEGLEEAYELLRRVYNRFKEEPTIPYNLACYAAVLKRREEALSWLKLACKRGNRDAIIKMAAHDEDLADIQPLLSQL